jgi:hypothetical protein
MHAPTLSELRSLFQLLERRAPDLKGPCRWLLLGPNFAKIILAGHARPPAVEDLTLLMRLIQSEAPHLIPLGRWLVAASEQSAATQVELQLDQLETARPEDWSHPVQILDRPRADLEAMLRACRLRLLSASDSRRERLLSVSDKLERAVRIATSAEQRRQEMKGKGTSSRKSRKSPKSHKSRGA